MLYKTVVQCVTYEGVNFGSNFQHGEQPYMVELTCFKPIYTNIYTYMIYDYIYVHIHVYIDYSMINW